VHVPPHAFPQAFNSAGIFADEGRREVVANQGQNGRPANVADTVGITHSFQAVGSADTRHDKSEVGDVTVCRVRQDDRQRDPVMFSANLRNLHFSSISQNRLLRHKPKLFPNP